MTRIPTHRSLVRRAGAHIWQALEDHQWLPLAIALLAVTLINL